MKSVQWLKPLRVMLPYMKEHPFIWIVGLVVPCLANLASSLMMAYAMQYYTDIMTGSGVLLSRVVHMMLIVIAALVFVTLVEDAARFALTVFIVNAEGGVKRDVFSSVVKAKYIEMSRMSRGEILSRYQSDSQISVGLITYDIFSIIYPIIMGVGYLIAVFIASALIGLLMLILAAAVIAISIFFMKKFAKLQKQGLALKDRYVVGIEGAVRGRMSIRLLSAQDNVSQRIKTMSQAMLDNDLKGIRLTLWRTLTKDSLSSICSALMAPFACVLAAYGMLPVASVALIIQLSRSLIPITGGLGSALNQMKIHTVSGDRVQEVLNIEHETYDNGDAVPISENPNLLCVDNACVKYGDQTILPAVTFNVREGEIIALVGPSGSGKSSMIRALLGLADYNGSIRFKGRDIHSLKLGELRGAIAYVPELSDIFNGTVLENLELADPEIDEAQMYEALHKAALDEEILNQEVGLRGEKLSGGQRQRVAITRALLKKAPLIVLDEPTAALDPQSEQKILETIIALKKSGKGIVIVTHRESTAKIADRVCMIGVGE